MNAHHSKAYVTTDVQTTDPLGLVIALYEKAIATVTQAMEAVETGDATRRGEAVQLACEIINVLVESLDFSHNESIAGSLFSLYHSQIYQLYMANRHNDLAPLQTVRGTLTILLDGWQEIARTQEAAQLRGDAVGFRREALSGQTTLAMTA